jgi:hypothetical protein
MTVYARKLGNGNLSSNITGMLDSCNYQNAKRKYRIISTPHRVPHNYANLLPLTGNFYLCAATPQLDMSSASIHCDQPPHQNSATRLSPRKGLPPPTPLQRAYLSPFRQNMTNYLNNVCSIVAIEKAGIDYHGISWNNLVSYSDTGFVEDYIYIHTYIINVFYKEQRWLLQTISIIMKEYTI